MPISSSIQKLGNKWHPGNSAKISSRLLAKKLVSRRAGDIIRASFRLLLLLDHVQITALSRALQININIAYLDGRGANGVVDFVEFRNDKDTTTSPLILLYRYV